MNITGNCQGSDTVEDPGCEASNTGPLVITGACISGARNLGCQGNVWFSSTATNYILVPKNSSYSDGTVNANSIELTMYPGTTNVKSGTGYGSVTGTLSTSGGGSAWVN
jgi:hypothetical protein